MAFRGLLFFVALCLLQFNLAFAQTPEQQSSWPGPEPDSRFKADLLLIVAHPDDEGMLGSYLARLAIDEGKRVAVVYTTRGDSGANAIGYEQGDALGAIREIEGRQALASLRISLVWFLGMGSGLDTPGDDVLHSLKRWNHGSALEEIVRLVRLTRPEVMVTWLPNYSVGQNHGDHQAAGVIATEAFDLAGDAAAFPAQLAFPAEYYVPGQTVEGLRLWRPKKLYYVTDAFHTEFTAGRGPQYRGDVISPSRKIPYNRLAAEMTSFHLSQDGSGQLAKEALEKNDLNSLTKGDLPVVPDPVRFILGKSLVEGTVTGDVFEGIGKPVVSPVQSPAVSPQPSPDAVLQLGGPWSFYRQFWRTHNLDHLSGLYPPEMRATAGRTFKIPLLLRNDTPSPVEITLEGQVPRSWMIKSGARKYLVPAGGKYPADAVVEVPANAPPSCQNVSWKATGTKIEARVTVRVYLDRSDCYSQ